MFFILSKILLFLLDPLIWIFILLLWGILKKDNLKKKKILLTTLFVFYFFSNSFIADEFVRAYEEHNQTYTDLTEKYDLAVVLGGFSSYNYEQQQVEFHSSTDRLMAGIKLYKTGRVKKLMIVSGSGQIMTPNQKEAIFINQYLLSIGIPSKDLIIESESKNTRENAVFASKILKKKYKDGKYILVTSAMHMPRAKRCFKKVKLHVTPFSVDHQTESRKYVFDHLFIPNLDSLKRWKALIREWVGFTAYKMNGYL